MAVVTGFWRVACIITVPHVEILYREVEAQFAHIAVLGQRHIVAQRDILQFDEVAAVEETAAGIGVGQADEAGSLAIARILLREPHVLIFPDAL